MSDTLENEFILLLICKTCRSIQEIPYSKAGKYLGEGKYDQADNPFLMDAIGPCERQGHVGMLTDVNFVYWMTPNIKEAIINQIKETFTGGDNIAKGLDVFGTSFYDLKDTYSADAMSCWQLHNKPKGQCSDYKVERKLLSVGTDKERQEAGLGRSNVKVYLCDFCPVKMYNQKKAYEERGLYK